MRYIPLLEADKQCLDQWLVKSEEIFTELDNETNRSKRLAIIRKNRTHWRDENLILFLKSLSNGKCWYTETRFSAEYPQIEHFRPKA